MPDDSGFVFPPPPPPPPPKVEQQDQPGYTPQFSRGRGRPIAHPGNGYRGGRGAYRGDFGHGRAAYHHIQGNSATSNDKLHFQQITGCRSQQARPESWGGYGRSDFRTGDKHGHQPQQKSQHYSTEISTGPSSGYPSGHWRGQKRPFLEAFGRGKAAKVSAPPAVPTFGAPLPVAIPHVSPSSQIVQQKKSRVNLLGLTPVTLDPESSSEEEDEVDEEAKLATAIATGPSKIISFEHNGKVTHLRTPEEIAAWILERRRNYPTKTKQEERKRRLEEAQRKAKEVRSENAKARKVAGEERKRFIKEKKEDEAKRRNEKYGRGKTMPERRKHNEVESGNRRGCIQEEGKSHRGGKYEPGLNTKTVSGTESEAGLKQRLEEARQQIRDLEAQLAAPKMEKSEPDGNSVESITPSTNLEPQGGTRSKHELVAVQRPRHTHATLDISDSSSTISSTATEDITSSSGSDSSDIDGSSFPGNVRADETFNSSSNESHTDDSVSDSGVPERQTTSHSKDWTRKLPTHEKRATVATCKRFARTGHCRFGSDCRYEHSRRQRPGKEEQRKGPGPRMTLLQRLLKRQEEEEKAEAEAEAEKDGC